MVYCNRWGGAGGRGAYRTEHDLGQAAINGTSASVERLQAVQTIGQEIVFAIGHVTTLAFEGHLVVVTGHGADAAKTTLLAGTHHVAGHLASIRSVHPNAPSFAIELGQRRGLVDGPQISERVFVRVHCGQSELQFGHRLATSAETDPTNRAHTVAVQIRRSQRATGLEIVDTQLPKA